MTKIKQKYGLLIVGIVLGIVYGLATRWVFGEKATLASVTYLFLIPTILGMIPLMFADDEKLRLYRNVIFIPWLTVASFFLVMFFLVIEDIICLLVLAAPFFVLGTLGALLYRMMQLNRKRNKGKLLSLVLLPFLLAPMESYISTPSDVFTIKNEVLVDATPLHIWNNIVEVSPIDAQEYQAGFFNAVGIPRPISARVDRRMVGGKRIGSFEGGLLFIETIKEYEEGKKVSFDIQIDPSTVRQKIFDQHVLNGNYFVFVDATYALEKQQDGQVKLSLSSRYRLTSTVNFYGKFWGDLILSDFQDRLLKVIERRCEGI